MAPLTPLMTDSALINPSWHFLMYFVCSCVIQPSNIWSVWCPDWGLITSYLFFFILTTSDSTVLMNTAMHPFIPIFYFHKGAPMSHHELLNLQLVRPTFTYLDFTVVLYKNLLLWPVLLDVVTVKNKKQTTAIETGIMVLK